MRHCPKTKKNKYWLYELGTFSVYLCPLFFKAAMNTKRARMER